MKLNLFFIAILLWGCAFQDPPKSTESAQASSPMGSVTVSWVQDSQPIQVTRELKVKQSTDSRYWLALNSTPVTLPVQVPDTITVQLLFPKESLGTGISKISAYENSETKSKTILEPKLVTKEARENQTQITMELFPISSVLKAESESTANINIEFLDDNLRVLLVASLLIRTEPKSASIKMHLHDAIEHLPKTVFEKSLSLTAIATLEITNPNESAITVTGFHRSTATGKIVLNETIFQRFTNPDECGGNYTLTSREETISGSLAFAVDDSSTDLLNPYHYSATNIPLAGKSIKKVAIYFDGANSNRLTVSSPPAIQSSTIKVLKNCSATCSSVRGRQEFDGIWEECQPGWNSNVCLGAKSCHDFLGGFTRGGFSCYLWEKQRSIPGTKKACRGRWDIQENWIDLNTYIVRNGISVTTVSPLLLTTLYTDESALDPNSWKSTPWEMEKIQIQKQ
ncbi:MAG: hypothetical protein AB7F66_13465 [Bacteriovoracia bacterium]